MKLSRSGIGLCSLTVIGLLAAWSLLAADSPKPQPQREGFTSDFVLIQRQDGSLTVLRNPQLGTLGNKTYLVGQTLSWDDVSSDDVFFDSTVEWICLADIRRLSETDSNIGGRIRDIRNARQALRAR